MESRVVLQFESRKRGNSGYAPEVMPSISRFVLLGTVVLVVTSAGCAHPSEGRVSEWVSRGADGKLVYKTTERGDRIMDFSHAGYMGGGVAIPDVPVMVTVKP